MLQLFSGTTSQNSCFNTLLMCRCDCLGQHAVSLWESVTLEGLCPSEETADGVVGT